MFNLPPLLVSINLVALVLTPVFLQIAWKSDDIELSNICFILALFTIPVTAVNTTYYLLFNT